MMAKNGGWTKGQPFVPSFLKFIDELGGTIACKAQGETQRASLLRGRHDCIQDLGS
jgi:hypothetical protein